MKKILFSLISLFILSIIIIGGSIFSTCFEAGGLDCAIANQSFIPYLVIGVTYILFTIFLLRSSNTSGGLLILVFILISIITILTPYILSSGTVYNKFIQNTEFECNLYGNRSENSHKSYCYIHLAFSLKDTRYCEISRSLYQFSSYDLKFTEKELYCKNYYTEKGYDF